MATIYIPENGEMYLSWFDERKKEAQVSANTCYPVLELKDFAPLGAEPLKMTLDKIQ